MGYNPTKAKKYYKRSQAARGGYRSASSYAGKAGMHLVKEVGVSALKKVLGLNTENKNWDSTAGGTMTGTLATHLNPFIGLAQGNTNTTRNGNGCRVTHMTLKGFISNNVANGNQAQCRIIITLQKNVVATTSGVTPAQLMQDPTNINSPYNTDLEDVKVLCDKLVIVKPQYSGQIATNKFRYKWNPSYNDGHLKWTDSDTTGAVANQLQGILKVFVMSDQASNYPIFTTYCRAHFVDN